MDEYVAFLIFLFFSILKWRLPSAGLLTGNRHKMFVRSSDWFAVTGRVYLWFFFVLHKLIRC